MIKACHMLADTAVAEQLTEKEQEEKDRLLEEV